MSRRRRYFSPDEKMAVLRDLLRHGSTVSRVCRQNRIVSSVVLRWKKQLLDKGAAAFWVRPVAARPSARDVAAAIRMKTLVATPRESSRELMTLIEHGKVEVKTLKAGTCGRQNSSEVVLLLDCIYHKPLKYRNRAVAILAYGQGVPVSQIAKFLGVAHSSVDNWVLRFNSDRGVSLVRPYQKKYRKTHDKKYQDAVFAILHAPPSSFDINRATWRLNDIQEVMKRRDLPLARRNVSKIIKDAGYHYRKAKTVLTSTDPRYHQKLKQITKILSNLEPNEKFFSVDEFGWPFFGKARSRENRPPTTEQQRPADYYRRTRAVHEPNYALLLRKEKHC
jgi:transposase